MAELYLVPPPAVFVTTCTRESRRACPATCQRRTCWHPDRGLVPGIPVITATRGTEKPNLMALGALRNHIGVVPTFPPAGTSRPRPRHAARVGAALLGPMPERSKCERPLLRFSAR